MKYLLDTHTAIWAFADDVNLSKNVREIIADTSNSLYISIVSAWELAIKISLGKLDFPGGVSTFLTEVEENGIEIIGIDSSYIKCVEKLPFIHRDPFDRLIIATAKIDNATLLTADENIHKYEVNWKW